MKSLRWRVLTLATAVFMCLLSLYTQEIPAEAKLSNKSARALEILRGSKRERIERDKAREEELFRNSATVVRVMNKSTDSEIRGHLVQVVEKQLANLGFRVKDHLITKAVVEKKNFNGFKSTKGLNQLGHYLKTNHLIFLTVEKCLISTFADELYDHVQTGHITLPHREFIELQVRMSVFDVHKNEVRYSRRDRQFIPLKDGPGCPDLQEAFHFALHDCVNNLLIEMRPQYSLVKAHQ